MNLSATQKMLMEIKMQDRFKFRVFLKYNQIMCDIDSYCFLQGLNKCVFHFTNGGQKTLKNDDFILIQCTGLKDKKGKLIYEGDIVKIEYYDFEIKHRIGIVEWEDDGFCITYHNPKDTKVSGCSLVDIVNGDKQEVIGNIYENPELLEV